MSRLSELKAKQELEAKIAAKLATGKFKDTGVKYTAEQAMSDHNNRALRMTAQANGNTLEWK